MSFQKGAVAILSNVIALILAAIAVVLSFILYDLNDSVIQIQLVLSISSLLLLAFLTSIIAYFYYKDFIHKCVKFSHPLIETFFDLLPVTEVIILILWLGVAVSFIS